MPVNSFTDKDEKILWQGSPPKGLIVRPFDVVVTLFLIFWTGVAIFWEWTVVSSFLASSDGDIGELFRPPAIMFVGIGGLFILVGVIGIFGRPLLDAAIRSRTEYAVTNKRALISKGLFRRSVKSMPLTESLQTELSGGTIGSIRFGRGYNLFDYAWGFGFWIGPPHPFIFERIGDVRRVHDIVRKVQEGSA